MTDEDTQNLIEKFVDGASRRDVLKTGALTTAGLTVAGTGTAAAQIDEEEGVGVDDDDDVFVNDEQWNCVMFQNDYRPESEFVITSPVIDWTPNVPANLGSPFQGYNTRMIRYRGTGDNVLFFQSQDAQIPQFDEELGYVPDGDEEFAENETPQPQVFSLWQDATFHEETTRLVTANFSPVEEDFEDSVLGEEGSDFGNEDDWLF